MIEEDRFILKSKIHFIIFICITYFKLHTECLPLYTKVNLTQKLIAMYHVLGTVPQKVANLFSGAFQRKILELHPLDMGIVVQHSHSWIYHIPGLSSFYPIPVFFVIDVQREKKKYEVIQRLNHLARTITFHRNVLIGSTYSYCAYWTNEEL